MSRFTNALMGSLFGAGALLGSTAASFGADTIKVAFIDPLSGPFAATGTSGLAHYRYAAEELVNKTGGVLGGTKFEIVPFDNKISAKESLIQLKVAIDQGIRFIAQGNSSGVANAITDAVKKHNRRNPDQRVLFLNYSAVDPALTNAKCNFWHFRFDANADIKMDALTDVMATDTGIKKVYLIGQDYSFGKAVAAAAVRFLGEKRPDIEIVGNELHPIGKVKDFTPYARKIVSSGADAMITGNWGSDMVGLGKAVIGAGFKNPIYTYYAASDGITKTFGKDGEGKLKLVMEGQLNPRCPIGQRPIPRVSRRSIRILTSASRGLPMSWKCWPKRSTRLAVPPIWSKSPARWKVWNTTQSGAARSRCAPQDHQAIQNVHIMAHTANDVTFDFDNSGFGLKVESTVEMAAADSATSCNMKRP